MKRLSLILSAAALVLGLAVSAQAFLGLFGGPEAVSAKNGAVRLALSDVADGKAHFYTYDTGGGTVGFFVVKSPDGVTRAAFNACDVCFPERKGYSQDGQFLVCNNCGQRFHVSRVGEVKGGCNPAPLTRSVEGGDLVIRTADLAAGAGYFRSGDAR